MTAPDAPAPTVRYALDAADCIVSVSDSWLPFAVENGAPELAPERVVGCSLWSFVAGAETRALYHAILGRVRSGDAPILLPFRCDSPSLRRFMRMEISPGLGDTLQVDALMLRSEPRLYLGVLDSTLPRSREELDLCSVCKRARFESGEWIEVEDAAVRLGLLETERPPRVVHTLCPECRSFLRRARTEHDLA